LDHLANVDLHKVDKELLRESLFEICKTEFVDLSKTPIKGIYPKKD
jgi:hypothetical protein